MTIQATLRCGDEVSFEYLNHRGSLETRYVRFDGLDFGSNEWYPEEQWFMRTYDLKRGGQRSFAFANITNGTLKRL